MLRSCARQDLPAPARPHSPPCPRAHMYSYRTQESSCSVGPHTPTQICMPAGPCGHPSLHTAVLCRGCTEPGPLPPRELIRHTTPTPQPHTQLNTLIVRVQQKGPETAGCVVVTEELEVELAELKLHGELQVDLHVVGTRDQRSGQGAQSTPTHRANCPPGIHSPETAGTQE